MTDRALRRIWIFLLAFILLQPFSVFAQDPPALIEHFSTETSFGQFSFDFPSGWTIDPDLEPGAVWLSSNPDMLSSNDYLPDEVVVAIVLPDALDILGWDIPDDNFSARTVIDAFVETVPELDRRGSITTGVGGEHLVVWIDLLVENEEGTVIAIDLDGRVSVILAAALPGEFEAFRSTVFDLVASISLETLHETTDETQSPSDFELTGNYDNVVSGLSFQYPDLWFIRDDEIPGVTLLSNSEAVLDTSDPVSGGVLMIILTEQSFSASIGDDLGTNAPEIVQNAVDAFQLPVGEAASIKTLTIGEHEAARTRFLSDTAEGAVIVIDLGERYGIVIAATSIGEFADFEATILSIAATIEVTSETVALLQTYSSTEFAYTFNYPDDWRIDDSGTPSFVVAGNVGNFDSEALDWGEVLLFVFDPIQTGFPEGLSLMELAVQWQSVIVDDGQTRTSDMVELEIGNMAAARIDVINDDGDGMVLVIDVGDGDLVVLVATTAHNQFEDFEATILAIAASVHSLETP